MERLCIGGVQHPNGAGQHSRRQHNTTFHGRTPKQLFSGSALNLATFVCVRPALPVFSLSGATAGFPFGVPLLACPAVLTDFADATSKLAARPRKLLLGSRLPRLDCPRCDSTYGTVSVS